MEYFQTIQEVADYLKGSARTARRLVVRHGLGHVRLGRVLRFVRSESSGRRMAGTASILEATAGPVYRWGLARHRGIG